MKKQLLLLIFIFSLSNIYSQDYNYYNLKRKKYNQEIEYMQYLLKRTNTNKQNYLDKLTLINSNIENRKKIVNLIEYEIKKLSDKINKSQKKLDILKHELNKFRDEYSKLVYNAYRIKKIVNNKYIYILASENFNQAYKRYKYIQMLSQYTKSQALLIKQKITNIEEETFELKKRIKNKKKLIEQKSTEYKKLILDKKNKKNEISKLSKKRKELLNDIRKKKDKNEKLNKYLKSYINETVETNINTNKKISTKTKKFESRKSKLIWPVKNGMIVSKFGLHNHQVLKNVKVRNDGIDISTPNRNVRCVYNGVVSKILTIPGANKAIIIKHGKYYTVYTNLVKTNVRVGEELKSGQSIGILFKNKNLNVINFQIWYNTTKLNPKKWIR